jgi:hypothetical protein
MRPPLDERKDLTTTGPPILLGLTRADTHSLSDHFFHTHAHKQTTRSTQSYFTTGGIPPISSSWCQAPWGSRPVTFFFFKWTHAVIVRYVTSSLRRRWVCLSWICLAFVKCTYRICSMLLKILPFALYTPTIPLSVQVLQSRSCLSYVSYATTAAETLERS